MATMNCLVTNILQNIFFCVQQRKETHTGLEVEGLGLGFWVNYPFNTLLKSNVLSIKIVQ